MAILQKSHINSYWTWIATKKLLKFDSVTCIRIVFFNHEEIFSIKTGNGILSTSNLHTSHVNTYYARSIHHENLKHSNGFAWQPLLKTSSNEHYERCNYISRRKKNKALQTTQFTFYLTLWGCKEAGHQNEGLMIIVS